jgi:citrate synthase
MTHYPTSVGTSDADHITVLGHDLAGELMGQVGFGELAFWLVTRRRPTPGEARMFETVLVALADHGFTPTAIAARLTTCRRRSRSRALSRPACWAAARGSWA